MTAWTTKIVFWNVTPCSLAEIYDVSENPTTPTFTVSNPGDEENIFLRNGFIIFYHTKECHIPNDANFRFRKFSFVSHYVTLDASSLTSVYIFKCLHVYSLLCCHLL